ncbi:MAG TPA: hotdog domain-containing protein [Myxococcota bacterium]|nr:hotdog domain-containing protein [Myxococcota bacterium]
MDIRTHPKIDRSLCGEPTLQEAGLAEVVLATTAVMAADPEGLVHGGFVFGAVDYAAMVAVNDPNVVLGSASVRFTAPVRVGERVVCRAQVTEIARKKRVLQVAGRVGERVVLSGELVAFVLDKHILE